MKKTIIFVFLLFVVLNISNIAFSSNNIPLITLFDENGRAESDILNTGAIRYLEQHASNASIMYNEAVKLYNQYDYSSALNKINKILQNYPNDAPTYMLKSQSEYALNKYDDALDKYEDAILSVNKVIAIIDGVLPRLWRLYICADSGNEKYLNIMYNDISYVLNAKNNGYKEKALSGEYNSYIWNIVDNNKIPSKMKSKIYKYVISCCNKKYGNVYSVPIIACYLQFIYSLEDNDILFKTLGKTKSSILQSYINVVQGQYRDIIIGIYTVASGNKTKGSNQISIGFKKIDTDDYHVGYALKMLNNSMRLLRPNDGFYSLPKFTLKDGSNVTNDITYKRIIKTHSAGMIQY